MSVRRLVSVVALGLCSIAVLAEEELPDIEFLEYLGMWEGSDEDWLMFNNDAANPENRNEERSEPVPEGEDSTETSDES
jgi:hypothetical protein